MSHDCTYPARAHPRFGASHTTCVPKNRSSKASAVGAIQPCGIMVQSPRSTAHCARINVLWTLCEPTLSRISQRWMEGMAGLTTGSRALQLSGRRWPRPRAGRVAQWPEPAAHRSGWRLESSRAHHAVLRERRFREAREIRHGGIADSGDCRVAVPPPAKRFGIGDPSARRTRAFSRRRDRPAYIGRVDQFARRWPFSEIGNRRLDQPGAVSQFVRRVPLRSVIPSQETVEQPARPRVVRLPRRLIPRARNRGCNQNPRSRGTDARAAR